MRRIVFVRHIARGCKAMTLPEVLIAAVLLSVVIVGMVFSHVTCMELNEIAKNSTIALYAAQTHLENIKNTQFDQITTTYNGVSFTPTALQGIGVSYIDNSNSDLLEVTISVCWRQQNGRIIGEDTDLDGQLDAGEDSNGNGILDSIVQVKTYIYDD